MQCGKSYPAGTRICPQDGMELMSTITDPLIGTSLPRNYHILSLLGRGSMSVVYKGVYEPLNQPVAIKMLKAHLVSDPYQLKRFQSEIKTAGSLNHPNIVGILDFGVTGQGTPYLIMDYLDGKSLSDILDTEERLSVRRAVDLFTQAADALAHAHQAGILHRDIKPSNLLICADAEKRETLKVVDFGIAKLMMPGENGNNADGLLSLTATGEVLGTPLYMSPEQANGKALDARSDIYALGCVLYHALTGKPPFLGDTALDTMRLQISAPAKPIDQVRTDLYIPQGLQMIVMLCLQKDPRQRYQTMDLLRDDLRTCLPGPGTGGARPKRKLKQSGGTTAAAPDFSEPKTKSDWLLPLGLIFCLLLIAGAGLASLISNYPKARNLAPPSITRSTAPVASEKPETTIDRDQVHDADSALSSGRYAKAEQFYKQLLDQKFTDLTPETQATWWNGLASAFLAQDKLADAKSAIDQALSIEAKVPNPDVGLAELLITSSKISCALGDPSEAERSAKQALQIRQTKPGSSPLDVAAAWQCLASAASLQKNYRLADSILTNALKSLEKASGTDSTMAASIANDLGVVREREGKYASAEELFNRALRIRKTALGEQSPAVADTLCMLGTLDFNTKKDAAAEEMFKSALTIRQSVFGEQSSRTAEVYSCLAILYDAHKQFAEAEQCYRKALNIREQAWGSNSPQLLRSLQNFVDFLHRYHHGDQAAVYELQIKQIEKEE